MIRPRFAHCVLLALSALVPLVSPSRASLGAEPAKPITNSIGIKLTPIPAGEFMMGPRETPQELAEAFAAYGAEPCRLDRRPSHRVRITKPFYLGVHEVTRGQFRQFVDDTGYRADAEQGHTKGIYVVEHVHGKTKSRLDPQGSWRNVGFEQTDEHPVVGVNWNDVTAFCQWLGRKEGKTYRLPSEAEWEYACRAGTSTRYSNGDDPEELAKVGNLADARAKARFPDWKATIHRSDGYVYTAPVGKFQANGFGLHDMHGNVWEWCADRHQCDLCRSSETEDQTGSDSESLRVLRGGSWRDWPYYGRSAACGRSLPAYRLHYNGFRLAMSYEQ